MGAFNVRSLLSVIVGLFLLVGCGRANSGDGAAVNGAALDQQNLNAGDLARDPLASPLPIPLPSASPLPSPISDPAPPPVRLTGVWGAVTTQACGGAAIGYLTPGVPAPSNCHTTPTPSTIEISRVGLPGEMTPNIVLAVPTDSQGRYLARLAPGEYEIRVEQDADPTACGTYMICPAPRQVTVPNFELMEVNFQFQIEVP